MNLQVLICHTFKFKKCDITCCACWGGGAEWTLTYRVRDPEFHKLSPLYILSTEQLCNSLVDRAKKMIILILLDQYKSVYKHTIYRNLKSIYCPKAFVYILHQGNYIIDLSIRIQLIQLLSLTYLTYVKPSIGLGCAWNVIFLTFQPWSV